MFSRTTTYALANHVAAALKPNRNGQIVLPDLTATDGLSMIAGPPTNTFNVLLEGKSGQDDKPPGGIGRHFTFDENFSGSVGRPG